MILWRYELNDGRNSARVVVACEEHAIHMPKLRPFRRGKKGSVTREREEGAPCAFCEREFAR